MDFRKFFLRLILLRRVLINFFPKERNAVIFMAMTVRYNGSANRALNHLGKNGKARSKAPAKVASGMKINSASDDASSFSISSRMRVKLRSLDRDAQLHRRRTT